jgi:hypothetical protein
MKTPSEDPQGGKFEFIRLQRLDENCRCCGRGTQHICDKCASRIRQGYSFIIEVKDNATEKKKKPTGYAIAYKTDQPCLTGTYLEGKPGRILFIRQSDLKDFLGNDYNNYRTRGADKGRLLHSVRKITDPQTNSSSTAGPRQATELVHG